MTSLASNSVLFDGVVVSVPDDNHARFAAVAVVLDNSVHFAAAAAVLVLDDTVVLAAAVLVPDGTVLLAAVLVLDGSVLLAAAPASGDNVHFVADHMLLIANCCCHALFFPNYFVQASVFHPKLSYQDKSWVHI